MLDKLPDTKSHARRIEVPEWVFKLLFNLIFIVVVLCFGSMLAFSYFYYQQSENLVSMLRTEMNGEATEKEVIQEDIIVASMASQSKEPLEKTKTTTHLLAEGDTLQNLAKRYWGDPRYYPVLFEYNPNIPPVSDGLVLKILLDRQQVGKVYEDIVINISHGTFFRYLVRDNDTWQSIREKFLSIIEINHEELAKLNSFRLQVGKRILVPLSPLEEQ